MSQTVVNIEKYGDYDIPGTAMIMIAPNGMSKKVAQMIVKEAEELFKDSNDEQDAVKYLKSWGCEPVKHHNLRIGGNL